MQSCNRIKVRDKGSPRFHLHPSSGLKKGERGSAEWTARESSALSVQRKFSRESRVTGCRQLKCGAPKLPSLSCYV